MRYSPRTSGSLVALACLVFAASRAISAPERNPDNTMMRVTVRGSEPHEFDWAKSHARARVVYTSSGPKILSDRLIDNDLQTVFRFSESDPSPTAVVELASSARVHRVSAVFKAEDLTVDVLLLNEMPKNPADLRFANADKSVVSLPDEQGTITIDVSVSSARYVALRWHRNKRDDSFTVAEISAFSNDATTLVSADDVSLAEHANAFVIAEPPLVGIISQ